MARLFSLPLLLYAAFLAALCVDVVRLGDLRLTHGLLVASLSLLKGRARWISFAVAVVANCVAFYFSKDLIPMALGALLVAPVEAIAASKFLGRKITSSRLGAYYISVIPCAGASMIVAALLGFSEGWTAFRFGLANLAGSVSILPFAHVMRQTEVLERLKSRGWVYTIVSSAMSVVAWILDVPFFFPLLLFPLFLLSAMQGGLASAAIAVFVSMDLAYGVSLFHRGIYLDGQSISGGPQLEWFMIVLAVCTVLAAAGYDDLRAALGRIVRMRHETLSLARLFQLFSSGTGDIVTIYSCKEGRYKLLGFSSSLVPADYRERATGKYLEDVTPPEHFEFWKDIFDGLTPGVQSVEVDRPSVLLPGRHIQYRITSVSRKGVITHIIVTGRDVTERLQQERQLQALASEQRALADLSSRALAHIPFAYLMKDALRAVESILLAQSACIVSCEKGQLILHAAWNMEVRINQLDLREEVAAASRGEVRILSPGHPLLLLSYAKDSPGIALPISSDGQPHLMLVLFPPSHLVTEHEIRFLQGIANLLSTAKQRSENETRLVQSEMKTSLALQSAEIALWSCDIEHRLVSVDERLGRQIGLVGAGSIPTEHFIAWFHSDDQEQLRWMLTSRKAERSRVIEVEHRQRTVFGDYRWVLTRSRITDTDAAGRPLRIIGTQIDIDARKSTEIILQRINHTLETLIHVAPVGIIGLDDTGEPVIWNPAASEILQSRTSSDPAVRALMQAIRQERSATARPYRFLPEKGEEREFSIWTSPLDGGVIAMIVDTTEQRKAIQERRFLEARLLHRQKLESIGTLASGVAHEINNPLTGIINFGQLISERLPEEDPLTKFADGIVKEGVRISVIVKNLLRFSRQDEDNPEPVTIDDIIKVSLGFVVNSLRKDQIKVELHIEEGLPRIRCVVQQMQQVLLNLITNAQDALNSRYSGHDPGKILAIYAQWGSHHTVRLIVEDWGTGISSEVIPKIFDPFFTTKPRDAGTGLGLSISYEIVQKHGGTILVESKLLDKTRFIVELPAHEEQVHAA